MGLAGRARERLAEAGLGGLAEAFAAAFRPVEPLAAAALMIVEPMFGSPVGALVGMLADREEEETLRDDH